MFEVLEPNDPLSFSIVVVPDSQYITAYFTVFLGIQYNWICKCAKQLNIKFVTHVGDIVEHGQNVVEWNRARTCTECLRNLEIPHGFVAGNHDAFQWNKQDNYSNYEQTFPYSEYAKMPYFGGAYQEGSYLNHFEYFNATDRQGKLEEFLIIHIEFYPGPRILEWVGDILDRHKNKKAILVSHAIIWDCDASFDWGFEQLIKSHCNVIMSFNGTIKFFDFPSHSEKKFSYKKGHYFGCRGHAINYGINNCGSAFFSIIQDFQGLYAGGNGFLRYYTFVPAELPILSRSEDRHTWKICLFTFNTATDRYNLDNDSFLSFYLGKAELYPGCQIRGVTDENYTTLSAGRKRDDTELSSDYIHTSCQSRYLQSGAVLVTMLMYALYLLILVMSAYRLEHKT